MKIENYYKDKSGIIYPNVREVIFTKEEMATNLEKYITETSREECNFFKVDRMDFDIDGFYIYKSHYDKNKALRVYKKYAEYKFNGENDIKEIYNSGSLSANNKKYLHIKKKFSDYIDLSGVSTFYVEVSATNENGESASIDLSDSINGVTYVDNVAPICDYANIKNEPAVGSWIKKGDKVSDRVITIEDGIIKSDEVI